MTGPQLDRVTTDMLRGAEAATLLAAQNVQGWVDDIRPVDARASLAAQGLAQAVILIAGARALLALDVQTPTTTPDPTPVPWVCGDHRPVQHRDRKPPWCNQCGRDGHGVTQRRWTVG